METNFNKISPDVIRTIALRMNFREILAFCKTNSKFNNAICVNNRFWMDKVNQDYGKYGHIPKLFHKNDLAVQLKNTSSGHCSNLCTKPRNLSARYRFS